jgi:pyruvate/2-oxoglutarate dehydrogenase complex dihydrolipoamide acyltransferase (E2) component
VKLSVNDFIVRAIALALRDVPEANASWAGESIRRYLYLAIARTRASAVDADVAYRAVGTSPWM